MKPVRYFAAALAALSLSACASAGPRYRRPELPLPSSYSQAASAEALADGWWRLFQDPALDRLVAEALAGNQDLAEAAARVEEARALAGLADAERWPQVDLVAEASHSRLSADTAPLPPRIPLERSRFRLAATLSYELDFWGRLRRLSAAARAELLASEEGRRNVRLGVVSEVAAAYFDLLAFEGQLAIARDTLDSRRESVRLQRLRFEAGTISRLELAQAEALDGLAVPEVPVGLPSQLLTRRRTSSPPSNA